MIYQSVVNLMNRLSELYPTKFLNCTCNDQKRSVSFSVPLEHLETPIKAVIRVTKAACYAILELDEVIDAKRVAEVQVLCDKANDLTPDMDEDTEEILGGFCVDSEGRKLKYVKKVHLNGKTTEEDVLDLFVTPVAQFEIWDRPFAAVHYYAFTADTAVNLADFDDE